MTKNVKITKISDKLSKVNDSLTINLYDNGYMVEIGGRDGDDEWKTAKIMCNTLDDLLKAITEATEMERE